MATLLEYFQKDTNGSHTVQKELFLRHRESNEILLTFIGRLHYNFTARAMYISIFVPETQKINFPAKYILNNVNEILKLRNEVYLGEVGEFGEESPTSTNNLVFTGRIFFYDENHISQQDRKHLENTAEDRGYDIKVRSLHYATERSKTEKPLAFLSHDSRDKELIAKPLAIELQKMHCPVWYDEFSLKIGDSLKESIEKGIKESKKCILIITKNFLTNENWGKREHDLVYIKELIEKQNIILPIWYGVTRDEVYEYAPMLVDRFAMQWEIGKEKEVARKICDVLTRR